ncbi:MAG: hypothetical protein NTX64_15085 [Elusimicrobia bacterium]|nr:hypothetical protein [Elusimicrobiota bacterium]
MTVMPRAPRTLAAFALSWSLTGQALAAGWVGARLWQEGYFWDALLHARDKAARQQADPNLLPAVRAVAGQVAQQVANLQQIHVYVKAQQASLRYAFAQDDPAPSLAVIRNNFDTLARGSLQIQSNLYYLTTRERMSISQALPDPELTAAATQLIGQIQQLQLQLNALYLDAVEVRKIVDTEPWATDDFFRYSAQGLLQAVVEVQDSVFAVYNAAYELHVRSRQQ